MDDREIQGLGLRGYSVNGFVIKDGIVLYSPFEPKDTLVIPNKDNKGNPVIEIEKLNPNTEYRKFKTVVIPDTVKKIQEGAFSCCENLVEIHIPASVESIAEGFACSCPSLKKITVDPTNKYYDSRNNCNAIICKKNNTLILGCCNTIIPEGVEEVGKKAFYGQWNLKFITIPNSVKKISDCAFGDCDELVFMQMPSSVDIDKDAFSLVTNRQRLILTARDMAVKLINKFPDFTENAFFVLTDKNKSFGDRFLKAEDIVPSVRKVDNMGSPYDFIERDDIIKHPKKAIEATDIITDMEDILKRTNLFKVLCEGTGKLNEHSFVDLGLPSGTKWATCNIGANKPEEIGNYFAWGKTEVYENLGDLDGDDYMYDENYEVLSASADVATSEWGEDWRIPSKEDFEELLDKCTCEWVELFGSDGRMFTGPNGNSIFLPSYEINNDSDLGRAGFYGTYWSSSPSTDDARSAWYLYFSMRKYEISEYLREFGMFVRPVCSIKK